MPLCLISRLAYTLLALLPVGWLCGFRHRTHARWTLRSALVWYAGLVVIGAQLAWVWW